jgi:hypothetical protein
MFGFVARGGEECFCRSRGLSYDEHSLLEHAIDNILFLGWFAPAVCGTFVDGSQELMTFGALGGFMRSHSGLDSLILEHHSESSSLLYHHATRGEDSLPSVILFNA